MNSNKLKEFLTVVVVQTSLNNEVAWERDSENWVERVQISEIEERQALIEIRHFLASLHGDCSQTPPEIILFPELSVPLGFERQLKRTAEKLESIIIAGMDYRIEPLTTATFISNEATIIVPRKIRGKKISARTEVRRVGKTYPAPAEKLHLQKFKPKLVKFKSDPLVWLFESEDLGKFGIAICYDFMDLDRIVMYRNRIQTLFILAYNQDTTSFNYIAEALSRMLFCNVVVCNCGKFGGSLAISPFKKSYRRTVYRHSGQCLANSQIVQLPLRKLARHQSGTKSKYLKSLPPGFEDFSEQLNSEKVK